MRARSPAIKVATSGYSTQQIVEKGKPSRWRVAQTITLDAADFTAASALITKLQDDDGLLLSGMGFSLADKTRRDAEDGVTQQAIRGWQSRAQQAAQGLGFGSWRPGHVTVQTSDGGTVVSDDASPGLVECGQRRARRARGRNDRRDGHGERRSDSRRCETASRQGA